MAWFAAAKDLRARRDVGDRLRAAGRIDEAADEYRRLMRMLTEAGLKLRATAACRLVLELAPGDIEAVQTLAALNGSTIPSDITLEVQPADVVDVTPPPAPSDDDNSSARDARADVAEGRAIGGDPDIELRRSVVQRSRLFAGLSVDVGDVVIRALDVRVFPAGATLMKHGETSPGLYAVDSGELNVCGAGFVVGETSALPENPATMDVVARTSVVALFLSTSSMVRLASRFPELAARIAKLSVSRRASYDGLRPENARRVRDSLAQSNS
jgi:hypothetical protein